MNYKTILVLLLIFILPLVMLIWAGSVVNDQQGFVQYRFKSILHQRLQDIDSSISREFGILGGELIDMTGALATKSAGEIDALVERSGFIDGIIVKNSRAKLLYPPSRSVTAETLLDTLQKEILIRVIERDMLLNEGLQNNWYFYEVQDTPRLAFWYTDSNKNVIILNLNIAQVMDQIFLNLPPYTPESQDDRIVVADKDEYAIYMWGSKQPARNERPQVRLKLSAPLDSYELLYFTTMLLDTKKSLRRQLIIALIMIVLGVYFYQEHWRAMKEASRRVSFVNQVSHELKTPLTNIRMYAELIGESLDEDEDASLLTKVKVIESESQRLSRLINNVLMFSQRDEQTSSKLEPHNLDKVISHVVDGFKPVLEQKGIELKVSGKVGEVICDKDNFEQILGNLISNVEKYAAEGKYLAIKSWKDDEGRAHVTVADKGPGVPEDQRERVFEPFYRIHDKVTEGVSGTGIGLPLSRELAEKNGGSLNMIDSKQGACFEVVI